MRFLLIFSNKEFKVLFLFGWLIFLPAALLAQIYPYTVTFETGRTHPARKSYASADTILCDSIPWTMPGTFLGGMTSNDFKIGHHAARMRLQQTSTGPPAFMEMLQDLPNGIENVSFYTAMYDNESGGRLLVLYSVDSGYTWQPFGDTIEVTVQHDSFLFIAQTHPIDQPVRLKIQKIDPLNIRIDVDSLVIHRFGYNRFVFIKNKFPVGEDISIYRDSLKIIFDHAVQANTGFLTLHQSAGSIQTIQIPSSQVSIRDSAVIFSGLNLQDDSHYYVLLSDSAFMNSANHIYTTPIADTTFWSFNTEDTTMPPPVPPLSRLNESFLACNRQQNLFGMFKAYDVKGGQSWTCSTEGHSDSFAVSISGGFGKNVSAENEDWLISELPIDLSSINYPVLSFWQKAIFDGSVVRTVRISYDYPGYGNPEADSVHWITLNIPGINQQPKHQWEIVDGIDLSPYQSQLFYLAFTYSCGENGAYQLFYDDIAIQGTTGIFLHQPKSQKENLKVKVLGIAHFHHLLINIQAIKGGKARLAGYDLYGRRCFTKDIFIKKGQFDYSIVLPSLASGIYILNVYNNGRQATAKFFIK